MGQNAKGNRQRGVNLRKNKQLRNLQNATGKQNAKHLEEEVFEDEAFPFPVF